MPCLGFTDVSSLTSHYYYYVICLYFSQLQYSMELDYDVVGIHGGSIDSIALLSPRVNVSAKGEVPVSLQVFTIRLPCSGLVSAEIPMTLRLNVTAPPGARYNDTILVFKRNKICLKGKYKRETLLN